MNYGQLKADVASYLHRADLTTVIPSFIEKARIRIGRDLRVLELEQVAGLTVPVNGAFALPPDFLELRRAYSNGIPLRAVNPHELQYWSSLTTPQVYCIRGRQITVFGATTVDIWYFAQEAALTLDATEHPTMAAWPQVWLAASMLEACLYLNDTGALAQWTGTYDAEVALANRRAERARQGTAPATIGSDYNVSFFEARN